MQSHLQGFEKDNIEENHCRGLLAPHMGSHEENRGLFHGGIVGYKVCTRDVGFGVVYVTYPLPGSCVAGGGACFLGCIYIALHVYSFLAVYISSCLYLIPVYKEYEKVGDSLALLDVSRFVCSGDRVFMEAR